MIELSWTAPIEVSHHARIRSRERLGWDDPADIRAEIRLAILEERVTDHRPNWTRGRNTETDAPDHGSFFAWNAAVTRCWTLIVGRDGSLHVRTLLLDRDEETKLAAERLLRPGYVAT